MQGVGRDVPCLERFEAVRGREVVEAVEDGWVEEGRGEEGGVDGDERHRVVCWEDDG
jgi:hypothetical protein